MKSITMLTITTAAVALSVLGGAAASSKHKYSLKVPGGLAFSEFRGYEDWQVVAVSQPEGRNEGAAIRNPSFRPFKAPVPFLLIRHAVISDWMFFLDNEDWLSSWARRFGESALRALAEQLRRTTGGGWNRDAAGERAYFWVNASRHSIHMKLVALFE